VVKKKPLPLVEPGPGLFGVDSEREKRNKGPRFGEDFAKSAAAYNARNMGGQNLATQNYQQFQNQIGRDPGLGAYYDRAKQRTSADMNQQLASRGAYGSSVGLGMVGDAMAGLDAQRAKQEAGYMLKQQQLGGQLAGQASNSMLGWTQGLGGLALAGDRQGLASATAADSGLLDRRGMAYDHLSGLTGMALGSIGANQAGQIDRDQELFESAQNIRLGYGAEGRNKEINDQARGMENVNTVGNFVGSFMGA
jgi:hypothetical protein